MLFFEQNVLFDLEQLQRDLLEVIHTDISSQVSLKCLVVRGW